VDARHKAGHDTDISLDMNVSDLLSRGTLIERSKTRGIVMTQGSRIRFRLYALEMWGCPSVGW
jgi:hypothetical protein